MSPITADVMMSSDHPLTNSQLPTAANWICVYALAVSPVIWCAGLASCMLVESAFREDSPYYGIDVLLAVAGAFDPIEIGTRVLMLVGGVKLRNLRPSGIQFFRIGLWIMLVWSIVVVILLCSGLLAITIATTDPGWAEASNRGKFAAIVDFLTLLTWLAERAWLLGCGIWLWRHGAALTESLSTQHRMQQPH